LRSECPLGLFNIFINNLEEGMNDCMTKFTDAAKLFIVGLRMRARAEYKD